MNVLTLYLPNKQQQKHLLLCRNGNVANSDSRATSYVSMPTSTNLDMMDDDTLSDVISLSDDNRIAGDLALDGVRRSDTAAMAVSN